MLNIGGSPSLLFGNINPWQDPQKKAKEEAAKKAAAEKEQPKQQRKPAYRTSKPVYTRLKLTEDETNIVIVNRTLEELKQKIAENPPKLIKQIEPAHWAGEVGYHGDYAKSVLIKIGDDEYSLNKIGYDGEAPNYDLRSENGDFILHFYDDSGGVSVVAKNDKDEMKRSHASLEGNIINSDGTVGSKLTALKAPLVETARQIFADIERQINQIENPFFS